MARRGELKAFRLLANAPQVFIGWSQMVDELIDSPTFSLQTKELIILQVAHLRSSRYEIGRHVGIARAAGLTEQQVNAIIDTDDVDAAGFSVTERTVLNLVTELCSTRRLRPDSFATGREILGVEAPTELLMIVSCYYGLALVLNAVELDAD